MSDLCYYCGCVATTVEHAPPRAIFPKPKDSPDGRDYRRNLITVPSCEVHNTEKSKEDEYLRFVLVMSLPSNEVAMSQLLTNIRRSIERSPKLLERLLVKTQNVVVHDSVTDTWHETIAIQPEEHRLLSMFTHIAKALYFHEKSAVWPGRVSVVTEFLISLHDIAQNDLQRGLELLLNARLKDLPMKGENPDVFGYQFVEEADGAFIRMHFYGSTRVSAAYIA